MTTKRRTSIDFNLSIKFNLRTTTPKNKLTTLRPIIRYNNNRIVLPSGMSIMPKDWNENKQETRGSQMYDVKNNITINDRIDTLKSIVKDTFKAYTVKYSKFPEPDSFKTLVVNELNKTDDTEDEHPSIKDLVTFTEQFIREAETGLHISYRGKPLSANYIKIFRTFKRNIKNFSAGKLPDGNDGQVKNYKDGKGYDVSFDNIGLELFEDFKEYMIFGLEYNTNTVSKHTKTFKTLINEARDRGLTPAVLTGKRYRSITEEVDSIYLTEDELSALYDIDLRPSLDRVRDLFLVGCWTGLRFSDFTNIKSNNIVKTDRGRFINIQMQKTGNSVSVPILPIVESIIKKYHGNTNNSLFPDDISNQKMNQYLKEIGEIVASDADIKQRYPLALFNEPIEQQKTKAGRVVITHTPKHKLITCHTARRSFATNAYHRKIPAVTIMSITGHRTESEFMKYIKCTPMEHAEIVMDAFSRMGLHVVNF